MSTGNSNTTQIVKIEAGDCIILPSDAVIQGITQFGGGVATSECTLPSPEGTITYYWFVDENPAEEGDQVFCLEELVVGTYSSFFPAGCNRVANLNITTNTDFIETMKSNPFVFELRGANSGDNKMFSITVPASSPIPYIIVYLTNDSTPWYMRFYPLETTDGHYSATVTTLSNPATIL